jgi:uncharacterized protein (TIGR03086 family)
VADLPDLDAHRRAQEAFAAVLALTGADQLDCTTPCEDWSVRDLVDHVIVGNRRTGGITGGACGTREEMMAAHADSAAAAQTALGAPGAMTRTYRTPFGEVPGTVVIQLRIADTLTHAWDLARATGQSTDLDPELAEQVLAVSRRLARPDVRGPGRPFALEQPCDGSRPAADRLAAFLGRTVS